MLGIGNSTMNKAKHSLCSHGAYSPVGKQVVIQDTNTPTDECVTLNLGKCYNGKGTVL